MAGRREILALYLEGKPLAPDVDVDLMARCTPGAHSVCRLMNQSSQRCYRCWFSYARCLVGLLPVPGCY